MDSEPTPAQSYLQGALSKLIDHSEPLAGMRLQDWYLITLHSDDAGEHILSRFNAPAQMPWTARGYLDFALEQERREWAEDDVD